MKRKPGRYRKPGPSGSTAQTVKRWLALIDALRADNYPNKDTLAKLLKFDRRTIQSDIATLRRE